MKRVDAIEWDHPESPHVFGWNRVGPGVYNWWCTKHPRAEKRVADSPETAEDAICQHLQTCAADHGYVSYSHGVCRCDVCRLAKARYIRVKRRAAWALIIDGRRVVDGIKHGLSGWQNFACRCETCREAASLARKATRERPFEMTLSDGDGDLG